MYLGNKSIFSVSRGNRHLACYKKPIALLIFVSKVKSFSCFSVKVAIHFYCNILQFVYQLVLYIRKIAFAFPANLFNRTALDEIQI